MRIRFGTYSLKVKSFSARELELPDVANQFSFNIYQKIFHFCYIPIFPVEKNGVIKRKETGKVFLESTPEMRTALNLKVLKTRSPVWSYIGLIVICVPIIFLLGLFTYRAASEATDLADKKIAKGNRIDLKSELVQSPEIDDLYIFKTLTLEAMTDMNGHFVKYEKSHFSSAYKVRYKINYLVKDSVGFEFLKQNTYDYTYGLKKEFRISKEDLLAASKGYQDLKIQKYPSSVNATSKNVVGIFEIQRPEHSLLEGR